MGQPLCRIDVTGSDQRCWSAELFVGNRVRMYRCGAGKSRHEVGDGRFVNGEILGMPGGSLIDERVYAAIEAGIEAWISTAVS